MPKMGKQTWKFMSNIYLSSTGTTAGPLESQGPLGNSFDQVYDDMHCGESNWELAERTLMREAIGHCLRKVSKKEQDIDIFLAGDLLNQTVTSNYIAGENQIPYLGMFGACSTSMETLAIAALLVDSGFANYVIGAVSSHNATAERQFRYPTEYGGPRPKTATYTVTGAGAALVSKEASPILIKEATIGKVTDWGIKDANDLGSAMAPAAADTIAAHLKDTGRQPDYYDLIVTGDLSSVGSPIAKQLLYEKGYNVDGVHQDCGLMIYRPDQPVFAGGSGAACSAVVTYGYIANQIASGSLNRVFVVATGALFSPIVSQQKETIPCIAHGVVLEAAGGQ
ncbi:stage V sporulation protein AD [Scopulibacillus daqui]|uniref:Stage V sporulation protein AD n=1 Tax=Scopulibacillus daqui TaxID=1469162 RepID=A0ABS2Q423_9BACL|nr:stage V sporulation protein AD [Scopulibacillus daqui]MBM7646237.1 stage V sporulation protein AD [Scopulibacillus daqui]